MISDIAKQTEAIVEVQRPQIIFPKNIVVKCPQCKEILCERDCRRNLKVCLHCDYHFKLTAYERIEMLTDAGSFVEVDSDIASTDPLHFVCQAQIYKEKLAKE